MNIKDDIIQSSLKTARDWDAKKNANWASRCYAGAMMAMLSKSLIMCDNSRDGIEMLFASGGHQCLHDLHRSTLEVRADVVAGKLPWSVFGGNYHLIVFSHVAALLAEVQISKEFLSLANQKELAQLAGKFWASYACGLLCLVRQETFNIPTLKLRTGLEQYWVRYLNLIRLMSMGHDTSECLKEIDDGFIARNQNSKIKDDQYEIEGSAQRPVLWDFRKEAILKSFR